MIVVFVSECEKKARDKTAQILDSFAERIGRTTWKTRMTMEGLKSVKILLSKNASRNTAVACHRIVGYSNSRLLWIVGNRKKFNHQGICPTNFTGTNAIGSTDNDWYYLNLIKVLVALSGLFHDWGKAWDAFQRLLKNGERTDFIRHEYISLMLFAFFVNGRDAGAWLQELSIPKNIDTQSIINRVTKFFQEDNPFCYLPDPISQIIGWLIVSHHLMPDPRHFTGSFSEVNMFLESIKQNHGYIKTSIEDRPEIAFSNGLPVGPLWQKAASKWAKRGIDQINLLGIDDPSTLTKILRPVAHMARTALILGDHLQSSHENPADDRQKPKFCKKEKDTSSNNLWAKSRKTDDSPAVLLESHLLGVTQEALSFCHFYPYMENNLYCVEAPAAVERRSSGLFSWQDKAGDYIRGKIKESGPGNRGFFGINMASTGTGKTFGNAKIMNAVQQGRLRYTLALGLRSLTLQTGDEYKERIGLDETELAVVVGSAAYRELHEQKNGNGLSDSEIESLDLYSHWEEINFTCPILEEKLSTKLPSKKARQILYSPVLVCTIDHIMAATEGTKRGRHILPWLRMLSSDLVIDEADDFDGNDLVAIMRLIHLAGMLGRNVMLSSATLPPAVVESAFIAYQSGWNLLAQMRGRKKEAVCAWIDEFRGAKAQTVSSQKEFSKAHDRFIQYRIKKLKQLPPRRKAEILPVQKGNVGPTIINGITTLHARHSQEIDSKKVSFGVIRTANIAPCVALSRFLLETNDIPEDLDIKVLTYHSRFPMLIRHYIERELDDLLKRNNDQAILAMQQAVRKHIKQSSKPNLIFIVVATPVEEVGRDHDFDWAILEPSSIRSLIQMSGRVMRHRNFTINQPNVMLLSHNFNSLQNNLQNKKIAYTRPGYECGAFRLNTHDLNDLLDAETIKERVDSALRIARVDKPLPAEKLPDLEHCYLDKQLIEGSAAESSTVPGWNEGPWHLSNIAQRQCPFRKDQQEQDFYLLPHEGGWELKFYQKNDQGVMILTDDWIEHEETGKREPHRIWLPINYFQLLEEISRQKDLKPYQSARRYGMVSVPQWWLNDETGGFKYNPQLGLWKENNMVSEFF